MRTGANALEDDSPVELGGIARPSPFPLFDELNTRRDETEKRDISTIIAVINIVHFVLHALEKQLTVRF